MSTFARISGKVMLVATAFDAAPMKNASSGPNDIPAASFAVSFRPFPPLNDRLYISFSRSKAAKLIAGLTCEQNTTSV